MKRYIVPVIAILSLTFAVAWALASKPVHKPTVPPSPPPESTSQSTVAAVGLVEPASENIALSCSVSGMVTGLYVEAGDQVKKGQRLFTVDDRDVAAQLGVKRAALALAQAQLRKLEAAPRAEEVPPAEAKVEEARAQLADAEVQVKLITSVSDRRAVREEDVKRRELNYEAAKARLEQAEKDLALLKAGTWKPDLVIARAQVQQAAAEVRQLETGLARLTMMAPVDGTILQNKVRLGQYAQCSPLAEPLMIFGGGTELHVRADVDESDAWRVRSGANAVAYLRGNSQLTFPLEFVRFEPYVIPKKSLTGDAAERVDTRVLQVIYRFRDPKANVFDGQQMDIYIANARPFSPAGQTANLQSSGSSK
jgi:multidrug resistance efflux pump